MSGPKVITYTMDAFKGLLGNLFSLQNRLSSMENKMKKASICDEELNIHYDCGESYQKVASEIQKALKAVVFDYQGTFDQKTYDLIEKKINARKKEISITVAKSETILEDFHEKEKDHNSFVKYKEFIANSKKSLEKYKEDISMQVDESFGEQNKKLAEEAKKKFGSIVYNTEDSGFSWGFNKHAEKEMEKVVDHVIGQESILKEIRQDLYDKIISTHTVKGRPEKKLLERTKPSDEIIKVSDKIEAMILKCEDAAQSKKYRGRFDKLTKSESINDLFFYKELHDSILECETTRSQKVMITSLMAGLNNCPAGPLEMERKALLRRSTHLLNCKQVSPKESNCLKKDTETFYLQLRTAEEEAFMKKKKQLFMKTQIIHNFEKLGYEVMEDLEVIDFEKENDFYLKAPGQENLLNIKFKEDGSFRYVFEIPEKKENLSVDEQQMKLHEMKTTCGDFAGILDELRAMGVKVDIASEKPIALSSVISIPESIQAMIKKDKKQAQRKQQIKKLYLD